MNLNKIVEDIQTLFIERQWTLAVAESCTGGAIAAKLTKQPGASNYFLGGIVCYSDELKKKLLAVPDKVLQEKGAVSQEVVKAMAENLLKIANSDFSIAISGIAGPSGGTQEKPVGTVWLAVAGRGHQTKAWQLKATGNRQTIIDKSVDEAFEGLMKWIISR